MVPASGEERNGLTLVPLGPERLSEAYPVVRDMAPEVSAEQWDTFISPTLKGEPGSGVLAIQAEPGFIRGLCVYRVARQLDGGTTLVIVELVVSKTLYRRAAAKALIAAVEQKARELGCGSIAADCPVEAGWLFDIASEEGYQLMRWRLSKSLKSDVQGSC